MQTVLQWGVLLLVCAYSSIAVSGCATATVKAVGDPDRPITINAHITLDIRQQATSIEDYVSSGK